MVAKLVRALRATLGETMEIISTIWRQFNLNWIRMRFVDATAAESAGRISEAKDLAVEVMRRFDDPYTRLDAGNFIQGLHDRQLSRVDEINDNTEKKRLLEELSGIFPESGAITERLSSLVTSSTSCKWS